VAGPAEWLGLARSGDAEAFCRLAKAEESRLYRQALVLCGEAAVAEDLVAETLIGAWQGIGRFDGRCRFSTWLYGILLHRFQKHARRVRSRPPSGASLSGEARELVEQALTSVSDSGDSASEALLREEESVRLRSALAALPDEHRAVLALRFYEEASLQEIAVALELPLGTVKSRLHHGLEKLKSMAVVVNLWKERRES
jgi:RNA polymerase sigma-70 factor (ECF subfamily)